MAEATKQITRGLARHILSYRDGDLDAAARAVAKHCILDWFAVTLAGLDEPVARILRQEVAGGSVGKASIIGTALRCAPADAALVNGTASHALDYDDVHLTMLGHATVATLPAVLALAETEGASGEKVLRAFVAGVEAAVYVGSLVMPEHYDHGFHATVTLGTFGAAAASGLLLGLDEMQLAMALGLAGTQAAGLKSMFGTMAKPLHAGKAAANGVLAARLAKRGMTANPDVLETAQGFIATHHDGSALRDVALPRRGAAIVDTVFKYHAACYLTHSTMEAVAELRDRHALAASDMAAIDVHIPPGHLSVCNIPAPRTGLETKFSLRHTAAFAAAGIDTAAIATYSDAAAHDPTLIAVRDRVTVHGDLAPGTAAAVTIRTGSGACFAFETDVGIPDRDLARQDARLTAKFHSLTTPVIGSERASRLLGNIDALDHADTIERLARIE